MTRTNFPTEPLMRAGSEPSLLRQALRTPGEVAEARWLRVRSSLRAARKVCCVFAAIALTVISATNAHADVYGTTAIPILRGSDQAAARMMLFSPLAPVYALNGELVYDPGVLQPPLVAADAGTAGFVADGFEVEPGRYRFLLFDPSSPIPSAMDLSLPVIQFTFALVNPAAAPQVAQLNYTVSDAATLHPSLGAISFEAGGPGGAPPPANVEFEPFVAQVNPSLGADAWQLDE